MSLDQLREPPRAAPAVRRPPAAPVAPVARTPSPAAATLQRGCAGECTCGGTCGAAHDALGRTLSAAVAVRAPAGLLQRLKYPGQTCPDATLDVLHSDMKSICNQPFSCLKGALDCETLNARHAKAIECHTARKRIDTDCFGGNCDKAHKDVIQSVGRTVEGCAKKIAERGC